MLKYYNRKVFKNKNKNKKQKTKMTEKLSIKHDNYEDEDVLDISKLQEEINEKKVEKGISDKDASKFGELILRAVGDKIDNENRIVA